MQLPSWFLEEPPLLPFCSFFLRHFWILDTERPIGWATGKIPESKVSDYAFRLGLPADMIELFVSSILELDRTYIAWVVEQREKQRRADKDK